MMSIDIADQLFPSTPHSVIYECLHLPTCNLLIFFTQYILFTIILLIHIIYIYYSLRLYYYKSKVLYKKNGASL